MSIWTPAALQLTEDAWLLTLPWDKPPLSMNDRMHWRPKSQWTKTLRQTSFLLARQARIPALGSCSVQLLWTPPDRRRRDEENPMATLKPLADGLVDAGVVVDDTPDLMSKRCRILPPERPPKLQLRVERWLS